MRVTKHILNALELDGELRRFERREMIAERFGLGIKITVIILGIVGSVWGIRRIRQSRHEQACMAQAITWIETGIQLTEAVQRARSDHDHPTRGLLAVSEALYNEIDTQIGGGL